MLINEKKDPYMLRLPLIWEDINEIKRRLERLESQNGCYDEYWEIRTLTEMDNLMASIRKEMEKYGYVKLSLEKHDE